MEILVSDKRKNIDGNILETKYIISKIDNPINVLYAYFKEWSKNNTVIIIDNEIINELYKESSDYISTSTYGVIYFDEDENDYIIYKRSERDSNLCEILRGSIKDIKYNGAVLTNDICVVSLESNKKITRR